MSSTTAFAVGFVATIAVVGLMWLWTSWKMLRNECSHQNWIMTDWRRGNNQRLQRCEKCGILRAVSVTYSKEGELLKGPWT